MYNTDGKIYIYSGKFYIFSSVGQLRFQYTWLISNQTLTTVLTHNHVLIHTMLCLFDGLLNSSKRQKWPKGPPFCRRHYQMHVFLMKMYEVRFSFTLTFVPEIRIDVIGSDKALAPTRRHAIIWTGRCQAIIWINGGKLPTHICVIRPHSLYNLFRRIADIKVTHNQFFVRGIHQWTLFLTRDR